MSDQNRPVDGSERLGWEILDLLLSQELLNSRKIDSDSVRENLQQMKIVRLAYNDCVTILCKVADKRRDALGAPQMIKRLRSLKTDPDRVARAEAALSRLEAELPVLKRYRDRRLSHVGAESFTDTLPALLPAIRAAVDVVDELRGSR